MKKLLFLFAAIMISFQMNAKILDDSLTLKEILKNELNAYFKSVSHTVKATRIPLGICLTAAPIIAFAHHAPRLTANMHPVAALALTVGGSFCVGYAISGALGSALNRK